MRTPSLLSLVIFALVMLIFGCSTQPREFNSTGEIWGIYQLDLETETVLKLYGADQEISGLSLDSTGENLVFSQMTGGAGYEYTEIYSLSPRDLAPTRLTENSNWDLYPVWSPDGTQIAFLSWRDSTLDIYLMEVTGANQILLYDSGFHDADIDWVGDQIVFTSEGRIWSMDSDGLNPRPLTDPPRAGEWGKANLPFGDYDPRISPDGTRVLFSRLINDESVHGNYDLYLVDTAGSSLENLTGTGYSQGLSSWAPSGEEFLFIVSAINDRGVYDIYSIKLDGSDYKLLTPEYFPADFLIHSARYSADALSVYFVGQWWNEDS
jgi:TolB protein